MGDGQQAPGFEHSHFYQDATQASYDRHDERYHWANQLRDWLILFGIGIFHFIWMLIVFLFEPGIR